MVLPDVIERHITKDFEKNTVESVVADPVTCLFYSFCTPCSIYAQRLELLDLTGEPYVCCAGAWPCCGFEKPVQDRTWLLAEACCLSGCAQAGNRLMTQTRLNRRNSEVDNFFKCCHTCVEWEFKLFRLCTECSDEQEKIAKGACCVLPCTHCQNAVSIRETKKESYEGPSSNLIEELPVHFTSAGLRKPADAPSQMQPM